MDIEMNELSVVEVQFNHSTSQQLFKWKIYFQEKELSWAAEFRRGDGNSQIDRQ